MNAFLAAAVLLQVQVRQEPKDWQLIETPNFRVYYPSDELLPRAREFAGGFEEARKDLVARLDVEPRKINVFLYRSFHDLQQSSFLGSPKALSRRVREPALRDRPASGRPDCFECRPNPRARALALAEPLRDRIFIHCQASDRWNAWFIRHELAHHVQFEHLYPWRMPSWLIALKDPHIPAWWWEGGADYLAGAFDSAKDQFVRDLAQERLYDLKELHTPDILNPYDYLAIYHQGAYFWQFLDEKYGADTGRRLWDRTDKGLPLASQKPLQFVTGLKRKEVEADFEAHLRARWAPMMAGRDAPLDRLTDSREYYRRRSWGGRWSPDGRRLAWIGNHDVWPDLYVDGKGLLGKDRAVDGSRLFSPPSWSPDGARIAVVETRTHRDLLLLVDVEGGSEAIELPFDELYDPAWSPDGSRIAFAALKNGTGDLYVLHLADGRIEQLTQDDAADWAPAWSREGRLAWIKESEGHTVLHVLGQGAATRSWALLEYPQWSPDGKAIAVAADVGGVWDAFAVDPATGRARRLTKFRGGVSYPSYHPDGSLVVTYYEGRGQDLFRIRPEPQDEPGFDEEARKPWYDQFRKPVPQGEPAEKTRVWGVNWLHFPVLSSALLTPGAEFSFGDRDAENTLNAGGAFLARDAWFAGATVANTRWRPTIGATAAAGRFDDLVEYRAEPFVNYPLWNTLEVGAGWVARYREQIFDDFPDPHFFDSGPSASLLYTNQASYQLRDPAWGAAFGGTATFFREDLGGDRTQEEYFAFTETSFDVVQDWIVWTRLTYEHLEADVLLLEELLEIERVVRGAEDLEGTRRAAVTLEFRFPIWRDMLLQPGELIGLGEWLILKDLRGFAFGQAGTTGFAPEDLFDDDFGAASAGLGLRLDLSFMLWPIVNLRVPVRLEFWWAIVGQDEEAARGDVGGGFVVGF
jgi:hypothetical protein